MNNYAVLELENLTASIGFNYEYISDPPILGDIGSFRFDLKNTTILLNSSIYKNDTADAWMIDISKLNIQQEDFKFDIDGISDLSDVASRFLTYVGNTLRSRLNSIIRYVGPEKVTAVINKLLLLL